MDFLNEDRLFPSDKDIRSTTRDIYATVKDLPIVSPHGHTDPSWFAQNTPFTDAASLFLTPDHYILRMLHSQGISYDDLGVPNKNNSPVATPIAAWQHLCNNWHLFAATPSRMWVEHSLAQFFEIHEPLSADNAVETFNHITARLQQPDMLPRAILQRANVEIIATTEFALDPLVHHQKLKSDGLIGKIITTYRPDDITDPSTPDFATKLTELSSFTRENTQNWHGLIAAHAVRRTYFREHGATATDHGVPSALTADLALHEKQSLLDKAFKNQLTIQEAEQFRAQMLLEMATLSADDGMVMQIHAGSSRNTDPTLFKQRGANLGADIPAPTNYVNALSPLLTRFGNASNFNILLFTLDESTYARELAPMAGYWSALRLGPPWWFHDSSNGIRRFLDAIHESAGFYNLAGFNDDTRALLSIPARHDVWRREVSRFLALLISEHRISRSSAIEIAIHLSYGAAKSAYKLP